MAIQPIDGSITVSYEEIDGSPTESFDDQGFKATRTLECAFADRLTLAEELRGGVRNVGGQYSYTRPQEYPHRPGIRVGDVIIQPFGATVSGSDNKVLEYELARLSVEYRRPSYGSGDPDDEETLVTESLEPAAEFITMPYKQFYWKEGSDYVAIDESESPGRLLRMLEWVYTRHKMTEIPSATVNLVGNVNDSSTVSATLGLTFPAETLLYNPPQLEREITTEGVKAWRVTYRFTYRPDGWNKFPKRGTETMQTIYKKTGESSYGVYEPYPKGDFSQIMA